MRGMSTPSIRQARLLESRGMMAPRDDGRNAETGSGVAYSITLDPKLELVWSGLRPKVASNADGPAMWQSSCAHTFS
jgi:hypothetical protein